jgi:ectoine hydroxylase-related dioxygenase (phytanoyl-CoA dioxygenase family)
MAVLTQAQIDQFRRDGYLVVEGGATPVQLAALNRQLGEWVEESRSHAVNYGKTVDGKARFDLGPDHSSTNPRLRRINNPAEVSDIYRDAIFNAPMVDMVADLVGQNVKFHNCKLNIKLPKSPQRVGYHQDHPYDPHTNDDVVVCLLMLTEMTRENGALMVVPGSHKERYSLYKDDVYTGEIAPEYHADIERRMVPVTGKAGSVCLQHTWLVHGSGGNTTDIPRNLFIASFTAADAFPLTPPAVASAMCGTIVRGKATRFARLKETVLELPTPYKEDSFFGLQEKADRKRA